MSHPPIIDGRASPWQQHSTHAHYWCALGDIFGHSCGVDINGQLAIDRVQLWELGCMVGVQSETRKVNIALCGTLKSSCTLSNAMVDLSTNTDNIDRSHGQSPQGRHGQKILVIFMD